MHRFFVPPEWIGADIVTLQDAVAHQLRHVLRMEPGDVITVLDNAGWEYTVTLGEPDGKTITGHITRKQPAQGEPPVMLTLAQALLKKDNFEWVLQKATEIGVTRFLPVETARAVVPASSVNEKKVTRWTRILTEAAEQSQRGRIPALEFAQSFTAALAACADHELILIPWEDEHRTTLRETLAQHPAAERIAVFIGPEGGFTPDEIQQAREAGAQPVTLGPRILRAETAAVAAALLVLYEYGALESR